MCKIQKIFWISEKSQKNLKCQKCEILEIFSIKSIKIRKFSLFLTTWSFAPRLNSLELGPNTDIIDSSAYSTVSSLPGLFIGGYHDIRANKNTRSYMSTNSSRLSVSYDKAPQCVQRGYLTGFTIWLEHVAQHMPHATHPTTAHFPKTTHNNVTIQN